MKNNITKFKKIIKIILVKIKRINSKIKKFQHLLMFYLKNLRITFNYNDKYNDDIINALNKTIKDFETFISNLKKIKKILIFLKKT